MNYNLSYLKEIAGGDEAFIKDMVHEFILHAPETITSLDSAIHKSDWQETRSVIHQFAPQLDFMGMNETRFLADRLEEIVKGPPDEKMVDELSARIKSDCDLVIEKLKVDFGY